MDESVADDWSSRIVPERMAADRAFQERVYASSLSTQSWGLVMMAIEFEVARPEEPDAAHLVVDSAGLDDVIPAMREAEAELGTSDGGLLERIRGAFGSNGDAERREAAERLADEYAQLLTRELREAGKWTEICAQAS